MLKAILEEVHNVEHLILGFGLIFGAHVENDWLAPLVELTDSVKQVDDQLASDVDATLVGRNLVDSFDWVDHYKGFRVGSQCVKLSQVCCVSFERAFVHVEKLDRANNGGLLDVGVGVSKADVDGLPYIFGYSIKLERTKWTQG